MVSSLLPSIQSWLSRVIYIEILFSIQISARAGQGQGLILLTRPDQATPGCSWGRRGPTVSITDNLMWQYWDPSPVKNKLQYCRRHIKSNLQHKDALHGSIQWVQIPMDRFKYKPGSPQVAKLNSKWINFDPISVGIWMFCLNFVNI